MEPGAARAKAPAFLSDLGKATLRGIRKCPRCGTYNGTRGLSCKNKTCGAVFRHGARKPPAADAVRLVAAAGPQLYSVRQRERGPEQRCFVELGVSETAIHTAEGTLITQLRAGRCHGPACLKSTTQGMVESQCQHVKLALNCQSEATPLALKNSVLSALQAPADAKQSLWQLAAEPTGPLVQRVTKSVLVVKCKASAKHGPGFVHASFAPRAGARGAGTEQRFSCTCQAPRAGRTEAPAPPVPPPRCVHFLACVCAFASDDALAQEFADFLGGDASGVRGPTAPLPPLCSPPAPAHAANAKAKRRKKDCASGARGSSPLLAPEAANSSLRKSSLRKPAVVASLRRPGCTQLLDESQVTLSFQEWLASVTERIHQTMHYQFEGKPEPLVFHIPQAFFDALQQRISMGSSKKRLPNSTTAFVRKDALPLGTFSKYTWHITNILQVKQIFDTPEMPLEITRSFIQNRDGTYELFKCPKVEVENIAETYGRLEKQPAIRPLELKTFLKVGNTSPTQKEPTPFVIEWIPDILPQSRIGELRIRFEYGHHGGRQPPAFPEAPLEPPLELPPLATITFP